jgi:predicted nucleic acid-binding protein
MPDYFVDTWYFVARLDRSDLHCARARLLAARFALARLVTHDAVLSEFLAYFSGHGASARIEAARAVREVANRMIVIPGSRDLFLQALSLYEVRPDKAYSLVDCMSMVVMKERGMRHVLTNDHHFRQEGFIVVNE